MIDDDAVAQAWRTASFQLTLTQLTTRWHLDRVPLE